MGGHRFKRGLLAVRAAYAKSGESRAVNLNFIVKAASSPSQMASPTKAFAQRLKLRAGVLNYLVLLRMRCAILSEAGWP